MTVRMSKTTIISFTSLLSLTLFCVVASRRSEFQWSTLHLILGLALLMGLAWAIMAFRATMVAWVTVLVLLTFAGNRRRVLVRRGSLITGEVTRYFVPPLLRRKRFFVVACAALLSLLAALR
ncbi:uncharacterized protein LOC129307907 [Prosopis cineraria]|uniref:uncharacterized protein LOC129307907 n=1 Tax=Prosopis cineraria TaxID=364024 RepID=UPI00240FFFBD|nr:uncharacterized protein LOC129307907 [Prosopis cineraria]